MMDARDVLIAVARADLIACAALRLLAFLAPAGVALALAIRFIQRRIKRI